MQHLLPTTGALLSFVTAFFNRAPLWISDKRAPLFFPPEGGLIGPDGAAGGGGAPGGGGGGGGITVQKLLPEFDLLACHQL